MTSITQTFLNSKFEIAYFKAGRRMGVEEGKSKKTIGSRVGLRELLGTRLQNSLWNFQVEKWCYVNLCPNCSAINNSHLLHKCQDQDSFCFCSATLSVTVKSAKRWNPWVSIQNVNVLADRKTEGLLVPERKCSQMQWGCWSWLEVGLFACWLLLWDGWARWVPTGHLLLKVLKAGHC